MRGEILKKMLSDSEAFFFDTRFNFLYFNRIWQSVGFRLKRGPLVARVNQNLKHQLANQDHFDLIWVDKAIYLTDETTRLLRSKSGLLVHYTPDTAFYENRSRLFYNNLNRYDYLITTKSFEKAFYLKTVPEEKIILCTQGYNRAIHKPYVGFQEKIYDVTFIGLQEPHRTEVMQSLLDSGLSVQLGGMGWSRFVNENRKNSQLRFIGEFIGKEEYGNYISSALFSPGFLSKKFSELHTTRTFEIPACGTALLTESNEETRSFFNEDEAIFYHTQEELVEKIHYYKQHAEELRLLTEKGMQRVQTDGRDYESILRDILQKTGIL